MSVRIVESCVTCGACIWECPSEAISPGDIRPVVTEKACTECLGFFGESQCMVVCPVDAIKVEPELEEQLLARYRTLHPDRHPTATQFWRRLPAAQSA